VRKPSITQCVAIAGSLKLTVSVCRTTTGLILGMMEFWERDEITLERHRSRPYRDTVHSVGYVALSARRPEGGHRERTTKITA
jgi:hypothetical protein